MDTYTFYERDNEAKTRLIGDIQVNGIDARFSNEQVKSLLTRTRSELIGGEFDINNLEHWDMLPQIYDGTRLWVAKSSGEAQSPQGGAVLRKATRKLVYKINKHLQGEYDQIVKGSELSGNWGHLGRPGKVGGSAKGTGGLKVIGAQGEDPDSRRILGRSYSSARRTIKKKLAEQAKRLGYNGEITYGGEGYEFTVGGDTYIAGGDYNSQYNRITIYNGGMRPSMIAATEGLLAHEIMHSKWHEVNRQRDEQFAEVKATLERQADEGVPETEWIIKPEGDIRRSWEREKYDAYQLLDVELPRIQTELLRHDGISEYSRSYWKAYNQSSGSKALFVRAVNETLAEVARYHATLGFNELPDEAAVWVTLYNQVKNVSED